MALLLLDQIRIRTITASQTWPLRHQVMWPNKPMDFVKFDHDDKGYHFGLFIQEELVSVISLFIAGDHSGQFRKLATLPKYQGNGYASKLLIHVIEFAQNKGVQSLWCNARLHTLDFYKRIGMRTTEQSFIKENIKFIILKKTL